MAPTTPLFVDMDALTSVGATGALEASALYVAAVAVAALAATVLTRFV